jgi:hypothetical protein
MLRASASSSRGEAVVTTNAAAMREKAAGRVIGAASFVMASTTRDVGDEATVFIDEVIETNAAAREIDDEACDIDDAARDIGAEAPDVDDEARDIVDEVRLVEASVIEATAAAGRIEAAVARIEAAVRETNAEASRLVDELSGLGAGRRTPRSSVTLQEAARVGAM